MADQSLLTAAGRIADGEHIDWASITSTLPSEEDRAIADELALVAQIAAGHRQLHQLLPVAADTPPNLVPDRARWGHLDLLNIVGRGSYGTVYRAWDTRLERLVALKLFHGASNPDAVMQEGRMLARVRHENVVSVYGADVIEGVAGIWMELVHGRTLDNIIKGEGAMSAQEAAAVGDHIARAVAAVHAAGLLHCDVKAQNVVRENGGRVVLMDLGAGRIVPEAHDGDQLSDVAGTPRYMAPELFNAGAIATRASDIYSFGVLLYYLVSGRFPVDGKTLGELKQAHAAGKTHALGDICPDLPKAYTEIVAKAIARDAAARPESATVMQQMLAPLAAAEPAADPAPRLFGWWILAAAALLVAALVTLRPLLTPPVPSAPTTRSIAVLPIRNLTGDPAKIYLALGMTEALISNLARVNSVRVPPFASVATLADRNPDAETAKLLGVELLLAGSITGAGDGTAVAVSLVEAGTGRTVWSQQFASAGAGLLAIQSDIVAALVKALALPLTREEQRALVRATMSREAEDHYLRGLAQASRVPADPHLASTAFRLVTELAPNFAPGWAELAISDLFLVDSAPAAERPSLVAAIRRAAEHAIQLDPEFAKGYAARGLVEFYYDWNFAAAEATFRKGIDVAPADGFIRQRLAMLLAALGRLDEALQQGRESRALEPLLAQRSTSLGALYYYARDYRRAATEYQSALAVDAAFAVARFGLGRVFAEERRYPQSLAEIERALSQVRYPEWLAEYARVLLLSGKRVEARRIIDEIGPGSVQPYPDQWAHIALADGDREGAFAALERAVTERSISVLWLSVDPRVDPLRSDPRFDRLLARIGLR